MGYKDAIKEGLSITAAVSQEDALRIVTEVVSSRPDRNQVQTEFSKSSNKLVVGVAERKGKALWNADVFELAAHAKKKFVTRLTAVVSLVPNGDKTQVSVTIDDYTTQQLKVSGFVPAGPKSVIAINQYREFVTEVAEAFKKADPRAKISFTGRA